MAPDSSGGGTTPPVEDGPVSIPISFNLDNPGPITSYTTINATIAMQASEATNPIAIGYFENNTSITVPNMPTPTWNNGSATFQIAIDSTLVAALSSRHTTLTVKATSGRGSGSVDIAISMP